MKKITANPGNLTENDLLTELLNRTFVPVPVSPFRMKIPKFMHIISSKCCMCC
jgi:hypothetical protein